MVEYANKGSTPAHDVDVRVEARAFDFNVTPEWTDPSTAEDEGKGGVVLPSVDGRRHCKVPAFGAQPHQILGEKTKKIWVWGTVTYIDAFNEPCFAKFRFWSSSVR